MATRDITTTIYNGLHSVTFKGGNHRYYIDGNPRPGVTTIMSKVLAKPELMLWPLNMALTYLKAKVPKVTEEDLEAARNAHVRRRDKGSDTGTIVHGLAEQVLNGEKVDLKNIESEEAKRAIGAFIAWCDAHSPKTLAVEQVVYSDRLGYAGTFDSILRLDGRTYLCDLKTTNASLQAPAGIYAENFIQLGAYYAAYEEQRQHELAHGGTSLVEIEDLMIISCKKDGTVDTKAASELNLMPDDCAHLWRATYTLYDTLTRVKKQLIGEAP